MYLCQESIDCMYFFLLKFLIENNNNDKSLGQFIPDLESDGKNRFSKSSIDWQLFSV